MKKWLREYKSAISGVIFCLLIGSGAGASFAPYLSQPLIEGVIDAATSEAV